MTILGNAFMLLAGLGVFLIGMQLISANLQKIAGDNVNRMISKMSGSKLAGIGVGAGAAVLLESSSATTVILLGLVNAGIVNLMQATLIIMGANVGTTLTVVLISLNSLPIAEFFSFMTLVGAAMVVSAKKEKMRASGFAIAGFGMIFIGLELMSDSVEFLKDSERFVAFIASLDNVFLLSLVGALFAAVVQSSSATTGIVITLAEAGIMPVSATFAVILGSNIGTCMTAIIASFGSGINAKRTAFIHLLFNFAGAILFLPLIIIFGDRVGSMMSLYFSPSVTVAYFHVVFNLATTLVLIPFVKVMTDIAVSILPDKKEIIKKQKISKKI